MRIGIIPVALVFGVGPFAWAENAALYRQINFPAAPGREVILQALNDRGEVLGTDCDTTTFGCDVFLWTEKDGRRTIRTAATGLEALFLNNQGHVAVNRNWWPVPNHTVEFWTERKGWQTVPDLQNISFLNDRDVIYGHLATGAAVLWNGGEFYPVVFPPGTQRWYATQMNERGMLTGSAQFPPCSEFQCQHPFT